MKIYVTLEKNQDQKYVIYSDQYDAVKEIKKALCQFHKICEDVKQQYYRLIHGNIVLDEEKIIRYYNIKPNDVIWIGKLVNYVQSNDIIIEAFMIGLYTEFMFVIFKDSDLISQLRSAIRNITNEPIRMWNLFGDLLEDNQLLIEIDKYENLYNIIVGFEESNNENIEDTYQLRDRYFISEYFWRNQLLQCWLHPIIEESMKNDIRYSILELLEFISLPKLIDTDLEYDFNKISEPFMRSRSLFYQDISNQLSFICYNKYLGILVDDELSKDKELRIRQVFSSYFLLMIQSTVQWRTCYRVAQGSISLKDILTESLHLFLNILDYETDYREFIHSFLNEFVLNQYNNSEINGIIQNLWHDWYPRIKVKIHGLVYHVTIPRESRTINEAKKALARQLYEPTDNLFWTQLGGDEILKENDLIDRHEIDMSFVELVLNIDGVKILDKLAEGAFGTVFICEDILSKRFVLKVPNKPTESIYRDFSIRSMIEEDQFIPCYYGLYHYNATICIGMKLMSKGSLKCYIEKQKGLSIKEIANISYQILEQLDKFHQLNIMHRDIKSENIVLDENYNAKIIDFGLAKYVNDFSCNKLMERLKEYAPGTLSYMAIELLNNQPYTNKIDIWSFGILVIEMATGNVPYYKATPAAAKQRMIKKKEVEYKLPKSSPLELKDFINNCLEFIPEKRMNARELLVTKFIRDFHSKE